MTVTAEPPTSRAAGDEEATPDRPVDAPKAARARLEEVVGRELAARLVAALSGPHGRCDLGPW